MANTKKSNKKGNKLNLKAIESASKKFTTKTVIIPVNDVEYEVEIQQVFRTTKIEAMIKKLLNSENLTEFNTFDESVKLSYYFYLIIREFTDLDIPNNLKLNEELNLINSLIDLGIFELIMVEIPESEITKINEFMQKFNMNLNQMLEETKTDEVNDENKDIENFAFGNVVIDESGDLIG